jgi:hypothetical protein
LFSFPFLVIGKRYAATGECGPAETVLKKMNAVGGILIAIQNTVIQNYNDEIK